MARYNCLIMFLLATLLWINPAMALADTVLLYAAGSLRDTLTAGILKDEIANGAAAHVFASASMEKKAALFRRHHQRIALVGGETFGLRHA
jgi:hypothetical protein